VLALRRPQARVLTESYRVLTVDQPVSIDVTGEVRGPKPAAESPPRPAEQSKPRAMVLGVEKIMHQGETAHGPPKGNDPASEPRVEQAAKAADPAAPAEPPAATVEAPAASSH
jgi:hypothetical protein